jgi:hypothetical protein
MQCNGNINQTFIIETIEEAPIMSACTGVFTNHLISCNTDTEIDLSTNDIVINKNLLPSNNSIDIGTQSNRFREINTLSGTTTLWVSTIAISTPNLYLGLDSLGEARTLTADNSILKDDLLNGGDY